MSYKSIHFQPTQPNLIHQLNKLSLFLPMLKKIQPYSIQTGNKLSFNSF